MKQLILIFLAFVAFNLNAQEKIEVKKENTKSEQQKFTQGNDAKALAKSETKKLTKQLDLSSEQQEKVYEVYLNHFEGEFNRKQKIKKMIDSKDKGSKEKIKQQLGKQKHGGSEALNNKLKEVLTTEQYEKYLERNKLQQKNKQKKLRAKN